MTTQEKLIKRNQSLLELAEYPQNIPQSCNIHGVSRQHFYDIKKTYEEQGLVGLRESPGFKSLHRHQLFQVLGIASIPMR